MEHTYAIEYSNETVHLRNFSAKLTIENLEIPILLKE